MRSAIRITCLYLLFAGLWILLSDQVVGAFARDAHDITVFQTYKGVAFVLISSAFLFFFIMGEIRSRERIDRERQEAESEIQAQLAKSRDLHESAQAFSRNPNFDDLTGDIVRRCVELFGAKVAWLCHRSAEGRMRLVKTWPSSLPNGNWVCCDCRETGSNSPEVCSRTHDTESLVIDNLNREDAPFRWKDAALKEGIETVAFFPLHSHEDSIGTLMVGAAEAGFFSVDRVDFFQAYAHQAAIALESACLFTDRGARVERLKALRTIDAAIASTFDLKSVLRIVLDETLPQLKVDAADVLLLNRGRRTLEYVEGRGFTGCEIETRCIGLEEDFAGRAAREQTAVIRSLETFSFSTEFGRMVAAEQFKSYAAVPLIAKDTVQGVLELFRRSPLDPEPEWIDFLQTLAGQAAIAIENAFLFTNLELTSEELTRAYDRTLEGWSHALELRDIETHGHTQRVMRATLLLAKALGMSDEDLVAVRRGALLHDIGKLAIPDHILLKAGPLNDSEWEIMCLHPLYAHELLAPIPFLRPALDIPFSHHEWWDGTGYPRGLKGEQIPLPARVFAVIDVADALCSNRPYCNKWPKEKVLDYIRKQSGRQFDPKIVNLFLERVDEMFAALETPVPSNRAAAAPPEWGYTVEIDSDPSSESESRERLTPTPLPHRTPRPVAGSATPQPVLDSLTPQPVPNSDTPQPVAGISPYPYSEWKPS